MSNYSITNELPVAENGQTFESDNFEQAMPDTPIFEGVTGLVFKKCNLINCALPSDAVIVSCNTSQVSRCSHLHSGYGLTECPEECSHMVEKNEINIDGVLIDTVYTYKDTFIS